MRSRMTERTSADRNRAAGQPPSPMTWQAPPSDPPRSWSRLPYRIFTLAAIAGGAMLYVLNPRSPLLFGRSAGGLDATLGILLGVAVIATWIRRWTHSLRWSLISAACGASAFFAAHAYYTAAALVVVAAEDLLWR